MKVREKVETELWEGKLMWKVLEDLREVKERMERKPERDG